MKMPKFGIGSRVLHVEVPQLDSVRVKGPGGSFKGPKYTLGGSGKSHWKGHDSKEGMKVTSPMLEDPKGDLQVPKVGFVEPEMGEGKIKLSHMKPKFKRSKFKKPGFKGRGTSVDENLPKGDMDLPKIKGDLEGDFKGPSVELKGPDIDLEAPKTDTGAKPKKSRFKLPRFNFSRPKVHTLKVDTKLKKPGFKGKGTSVDENLSEGEGDLKGPSLELKGPDIDLEAKPKKSRFKLPRFIFSRPKVHTLEVDTKLKKPCHATRRQTSPAALSFSDSKGAELLALAPANLKWQLFFVS